MRGIEAHETALSNDTNHEILITKDTQCQKPANENPDHPWILTYGGFRKWISLLSMAAVRCPDNFAMYSFNDHEAYGYLEVCQNLMLDWDEATTWQQQWFVCEGLALFLLGDGQGFHMLVLYIHSQPLAVIPL